MEKILTVGILPPFLEPILFTVHTTVCMHLRHLPSLCIEDVWEQNISYVKKIARQRNRLQQQYNFSKSETILLQKKTHFTCEHGFDVRICTMYDFHNSTDTLKF